MLKQVFSWLSFVAIAGSAIAGAHAFEHGNPNYGMSMCCVLLGLIGINTLKD